MADLFDGKSFFMSLKLIIPIEIVKIMIDKVNPYILVLEIPVRIEKNKADSPNGRRSCSQ